MSIHKHRRKVEKVCPVCHKTFTGLKIAVTCSDSCRQKQYRNGLAEREMEIAEGLIDIPQRWR